MTLPMALAAMKLPQLLDLLSPVTWCVDAEGRCSWVGPEWEASTGATFSASRELGWLDVLYDRDRPPILAALMDASTPVRFKLDLRLMRTVEGRHRWHRICATRLPGANGQGLFFLHAIDVDELHRPIELHAQSVTALQHRMRSTFGVIRSIVRRTARSSGTVQDFANSLEGRIGALARVQASVIRAPTSGVELAQMLADELAAGAAREGFSISIDGPPLRLQPRAAETFALAVHELTTNAFQHGALGERHGRVGISWSIQGGEVLDFEWRESGLAQLPGDAGHRGYGRELLEKHLAYELKAETNLVFEPGGLRMRLRMPLAGNVLAS